VSLRTRLIAGLLSIATIGLLVLGGVTYAEQRSFLLERIDRQSAGALNAVDRRLSSPGRPTRQDPTPFGDSGGRGGARDGDGPPDLLNVPPGTYGQQRTASGAIVGTTVLFLNGQAAPSPPKLPADLEPGDVRTVDAQAGGLRYRVYARNDTRPGQAAVLTVAALPLTEVDSTLDRLLLVMALVIAGVLVALAVTCSLLVRLGLRPLDRIGETAGAIAAGDMSHRVETTNPRTEVGRLGLALNAMLARLEQAFTRQQVSEDRLRRFLADASHELRTPLSSIRGYAELFRIGAARDPADVQKAMTRIEQESARMGVLVEDLLTLARLDELPEIQAEPVDVGALARDAVDDARVTAPDRAISVTADDETMVAGDPHQLRQVFGNLMRNALVHTPPEAPIEVEVAASGEEILLSVRDHGHGLPDGEAEALFERFWRADPGRGRGRAGAGLGLAIVAGIVQAHGGRVSAANAPGGGACFTVALPRADHGAADPADADRSASSRS
jgi:two-component system OmpR family sensor kinase